MLAPEMQPSDFEFSGWSTTFSAVILVEPSPPIEEIGEVCVYVCVRERQGGFSRL